MKKKKFLTMKGQCLFNHKLCLERRPDYQLQQEAVRSSEYPKNHKAVDKTKRLMRPTRNIMKLPRSKGKVAKQREV